MSQYSYRPNAHDPNPYDLRPSVASHDGHPSHHGAHRHTHSHHGQSSTSTSRVHHLTAVPESISRFADDSTALRRIERALHARMEQYSNRDSDRFRQLLRWIKNRQSAAPERSNPMHHLDASERADTNVSAIRREQMQNILEVLGVFATQVQADALFDKYDQQRRGYLTLHELMCRAGNALETDFVPGVSSELASGSANAGPRSDEMFAGRGKRQFLRQKLTGEGERPLTPRQSEALLSIPIVVRGLREKLRINNKSGDTGSLPRARRTLARVFEQFDPLSLGSLTVEQLIRALHKLNFPLGEQHIRLLMDSFPASVAPALIAPTAGRDGASTTSASIYAIRHDAANRPMQDPTAAGFDYVSFVLYVYPDSALNGSALSTSLFLNHQLGRDFFDTMSVEERRKRGLPPTHQQLEAMEHEARVSALVAAGFDPAMGGYEEEAKEQMDMHAASTAAATPRGPPALSQFARERAPPTPAPVLPFEQHYQTITNRAAPAAWSDSVARNPFLHTVRADKTGAHFGATMQHTPSGAQVLSLDSSMPPPAAAYPSGSQTARGGPTPPTAASFSAVSPRGALRSSAGRSQRLGVHSSAGRPPAPHSSDYASSNVLNPFTSAASFIPAANLAATARSIPPTPYAGSLSARGPVPSTYYAGLTGAEAFTNILAAPAPERRPQTGVSVYTRGGSSKPLPPVRSRA